MDNTNTQLEKLSTLIASSFNILVMCHTGADPDALSSAIALGEILRTNYEKDQVTVAAERIPGNLRFIPGFGDVTNTSIVQLLQSNAYDLVFLLDFNQWHMASKENGETIKAEIFKQGIPTVLIDHHPTDGKNIDADIYLKLQASSTASNLYEIFGRQYKLTLSEDVANHLLYGIVADTGRFKFAYGENQSTVLLIAGELLKIASTTIEEISNEMDRYSLNMLKIVSIFIKNTQMVDENTSLTYIRDDEMAIITTSALSEAATYFANMIGTGVETAKRSIILYPHVPEPGTYTVRFRSSTQDFPVDGAASALGGGGHKQAAAARILSASIDSALETVKKVLV